MSCAMPKHWVTNTRELTVELPLDDLAKRAGCRTANPQLTAASVDRNNIKVTIREFEREQSVDVETLRRFVIGAAEVLSMVAAEMDAPVVSEAKVRPVNGVYRTVLVTIAETLHAEVFP